ncbi:MAG: ribosome silencing factor [Bacteroidales bacterium]|jgi:ribosome-associated protein|nr:ribosome silencing factor [Bacteroidales bacterium]NLK80674.1 ribosome silencing factor [Bacteroidales bacterium]
MTKKRTNELLHTIIYGIQEKKGKEILSLDFSNIENAELKYFVICEGDSTTHVAAIADSVIETVSKQKVGKIYGKEGYKNSEWIILDYSDIFVHIFQPHIRKHYNIEELWADCFIQEYN